MKKLIKRLTILLSLILVVLIVGCSWLQKPVEEVEQAVSEQPEEVVEQVDTQIKACTTSEECENLLCIDGSCKSIASLYDTNCVNKCSLDNVVIGTSDGETYTLKKGQGSFTFAGAIEWKIESFPDYCPNDKLRIPIKILKKSAGKILETQVVTLAKEETSKLIIHPTIERVKFTATLKEINEICS
ncbi:MAG: hypothetical protein Q8Q01_01850 [archaeon]|nr:hypothetical protein [archaeon]